MWCNFFLVTFFLILNKYILKIYLVQQSYVWGVEDDEIELMLLEKIFLTGGTLSMMKTPEEVFDDDSDEEEWKTCG